MKIRVLLVTLLATAISVAGLQAAEDTTPLGQRMEKMGKAERAIRSAVADPTKNQETLVQVAAMRAAAEEALTFEPAKKAELSADQQAKFVANYKDKMKGFIEQLGKLEAALKANDNAAAQAAFASLGQAKKEGHTEYKAKKKKA